MAPRTTSYQCQWKRRSARVIFLLKIFCLLAVFSLQAILIYVLIYKRFQKEKIHIKYVLVLHLTHLMIFFFFFFMQDPKSLSLIGIFLHDKLNSQRFHPTSDKYSFNLLIHRIA